MKQLTVNDLLKLCQAQVKKGNGDKIIATANDVEGNGYHGMFYGFSTPLEAGLEDSMFPVYLSDSEQDLSKIIILG